MGEANKAGATSSTDTYLEALYQLLVPAKSTTDHDC